MPEGGFLLPLLGGALKFLAPIVLPSLARKAQEVVPQVITGAIERIGAPRGAPMREAEEPEDIDAMLDAMSDEELEELAIEEGLIEPRSAGGRTMIPSPQVRSQGGIRTVGQTTVQVQLPQQAEVTAFATGSRFLGSRFEV